MANKGKKLTKKERLAIRQKQLWKKRLIIGGIVLVAGWLLVKNFLLSEESQNKRSSKLEMDGKKLALTYCSSCHAAPKAEILPRSYWEKVLPIMGFFLGAGKDEYIFVDYLDPKARTRLSASGLFPKTPMITKEQWQAIRSFYLQNSPEQLSARETSDFGTILPQFQIKALPWKSHTEGLSYLHAEQGQFELGYYTETESYYVRLDSRGKELVRTSIASPLADIKRRQEGDLLLLMGELKNLDIPTGKLLQRSDSLLQLMTYLERPINVEVEDFDQDGTEDILVAEFGKFLGGLNLYSRFGQGQTVRLHPGSGSVQTIVKDVNKDGLKDVYVLVAQEDESVYLFTNQGNLNFEKKRLLRLPAHYGTTHFELLDMDGDGDDDIICSSGDSGDYGIILKPFHGVRIFENQGEDQFKLIWFFPQQGAYGTASADYDQDGDIDIASIGYFASALDRDKERFIYFENISNQDKKWQFKPHTFPGNPNDCWMLIHKADVDMDGDLDILLGANAKVLSAENRKAKAKEWQEQGGMVTVLKNQLLR